MTTPAGGPLVLLVQASDARRHQDMLRQAGFRVHASADVTHAQGDVLTIKPALIAIELAAGRSVNAFRCAGELRAQPGARDIPVILYADRLEAQDIESAARARLLWVQIGGGR
jgi:PleD family two-component response regulator